MCRTVAVQLFLLVLSLMCSGSARAGYSSYIDLHVGETQYYTGNNVSGYATATTYGWSAQTGPAEFTGTGSITGNAWTMGASANAVGEGGWAYSPRGSATAFVQWADNTSLLWRGTGTAPVLAPLYYNFSVAGSMATSIGDNFYTDTWSWEAQSAAGFNFNFFNGNSTSPAVVSDGIASNAAYSWSRADKFVTYGTPFSAELTLDAQNRGAFRYYLTAWAYSAAGFGTSDFVHTVRLNSITFADGTTPESHGWEITFGSGIESPNIIGASTVPEPSSLALFGIGACVTSIGAIRRRRRPC